MSEKNGLMVKIGWNVLDAGSEMDGGYGDNEKAMAVTTTVGEAAKGERVQAPSDLESGDDAWAAGAGAMVMMRQLSFPVYWPVGDMRTFIHSSGEGVRGERDGKGEGALSLVRGPGESSPERGWAAGGDG